MSDPKCTHKRRGIVTTSPAGIRSGPHAATNVCDRPDCIADAKTWVWNVTGLEGVYVPDGTKK